ncbi:MAG: alternative ribosome rescue aminoacyl-tRNA hydrolase ArfB [Actinomycetota bacterium]|nr:alternative ribosome rescue aminoacyl-tRNA hydrolase ArfB [Actinomycetota bacterium]
MPGPLNLPESVVVPEAELSWRYSRSSGPGGQGVNTTDSRVELSFDVAGSPSLSPTLRARAMSRLAGRLSAGVLRVVASDQRSQLRNREQAERRMAELLSAALAPPARVRRATRPSRGSVERRIQAKKRRSDIKRLRRPDAGD